jgi:hypothetical protein
MLFHVSCKFPQNPLDLLDVFNQIHPKFFYRYNLVFYPFHEHCLLCLANLFC